MPPDGWSLGIRPVSIIASKMHIACRTTVLRNLNSQGTRPVKFHQAGAVSGSVIRNKRYAQILN